LIYKASHYSRSYRDWVDVLTRYTNSKNAVREKDFLALTSDFKTWARQMAERYGVYLEIQRGGWDSRRALQKQHPDLRQFSQMANAFDLLKVYGAGWLGEAGVAFGKNPPFLPNGAIGLSIRRVLLKVSHLELMISTHHAC